MVLVSNYIGGAFVPALGTETLLLENPATRESLAQCPLGSAADCGAAVASAAAAFPAWRRTPPQERIQYLFKLRELVIANLNDLAATIVRENGKTIGEARAEIQRGLENIEVACGIPTLMQGYNLEDVASGIDEIMIRQPLGVVAAITPFNFPAMIPLWFLPYAIACGNTLVVKPSERVPLTMAKLAELIGQTGIPKGVVNVVNGGTEVVNALLDHPQVWAISFVGSTAVARHVYARASANGKRVQCQGGAKNHVVVMPDADMEMTTKIVSDSAFGCAGQRCLAVSVAVTVGDAHPAFRDSMGATASAIRVGNGLESGTQMGPVITAASQKRILDCIDKGLKNGAKAVVDGRGAAAGPGNFVAPTVLEGRIEELATTEIFGPVLTLTPVATLEDAIDLIASNPYGNAASIFTRSGVTARQFRYEVPTGNVGVNIGVAAPMAYFPFSGWKDSFLGVLHGQGRDAVEFYTDKKVVIERWPAEWSRKF
jgi:malonate-semialdehyde dehydrogenase (acetylating)/methylmalonate-semialdehyde dehydrogenase